LEILGVKADRVWLELGEASMWGGNRIDLLTGPNGSGKSEILSFLANTFRTRTSKPLKGEIKWKFEDSHYAPDVMGQDEFEPVRVIAQTYSPFNRFPPPVDHGSSLTSIYSEGAVPDSIYVCAGLHKSTRIVSSSLSKNTLEQAIYRLSESSESASAILRVMSNLNLSDQFDFTYEARPGLRPILEASRRGLLIELLEQLKSRAYDRKYSRSGLDLELKKENTSDLAALITEALEIVGEKINESRVFQHGIGSIRYSNRYDYAAFQSLSLLRRLDLLTLRKCELTNKNGDKFDVANASSGQQQMLCSVIGLATALRNNSLILIDEPELSLHPRWQQLYLDNLQATLEPFYGCHVLIATHSPLIVQRGHTLGVGVTQVKREAVSESIEQESMSVEATLQEVFDTPVSGSVHLANEIFSLITNAETGDSIARVRSLAELQKLRSLYAETDFSGDKTLELIEDAIDLLNTDEGENA
jgi:predicted ATPase